MALNRTWRGWRPSLAELLEEGLRRHQAQACHGMRKVWGAGGGRLRWQVGKAGGVLVRDARATGVEAGEKADGQAGEARGRAAGMGRGRARRAGLGCTRESRGGLVAGQSRKCHYEYLVFFTYRITKLRSFVDASLLKSFLVSGIRNVSRTSLGSSLLAYYSIRSS